MIVLATTDPGQQTLNVTGAAFAGLGALFVLIGVLMLYWPRRIRRGKVQTTGTIVGYDYLRVQFTGVRWQPNSAPTPEPHPEVAFTTADGQQIQALSINTSSPKPGPVGGTVTVYYKPQKPQRFYVGSVRTKLTTLIAAVGCIAIGGLILFVGLSLLGG
ncbi:MAG: DUF3592 domain-containing protein [Solirubrobacterales bacterium]|nr:DUF3592 domain-containing protein [Solirubrobacterales bacterium]